jgi:hypothetical protein
MRVFVERDGIVIGFNVARRARLHQRREATPWQTNDWEREVGWRNSSETITRI